MFVELRWLRQELKHIQKEGTGEQSEITRVHTGFNRMCVRQVLNNRKSPECTHFVKNGCVLWEVISIMYQQNISIFYGNKIRLFNEIHILCCIKAHKYIWWWHKLQFLKFSPRSAVFNSFFLVIVFKKPNLHVSSPRQGCCCFSSKCPAALLFFLLIMSPALCWPLDTAFS